MVRPVQPPTGEEVLRRDLELLRNAGYDTSQVRLEGGVVDFKPILVAQNNQWLRPPHPVAVSQETVSALVDTLMPEIEKEYGASFTERPAVQVVPNTEYLGRVVQLESEVSAHLGGGRVSMDAVRFASYAYQGLILLPQRNHLTLESGGSTERPWDRTFLEYALAGGMANCLFRQVRGEWRDGYLDLARVVPEEGRGPINSLLRSLSHYMTERMAIRSHRDWGLHVVADKVHIVYKLRPGIVNYKAIDMLHNAGMSLGTIAMADMYILDDNKVLPSFIRNHPHHEAKQSVLAGYPFDN